MSRNYSEEEKREYLDRFKVSGKSKTIYARENGIPEMVGSIGSQTAVANNMQIVQGIKQGVKEAIQEADFNFTNVVNVGNETLYKGQQSYNKLQNNKYGTINV